jgi:hypothetical protein
MKAAPQLPYLEAHMQAGACERARSALSAIGLRCGVGDEKTKNRVE